MKQAASEELRALLSVLERELGGRDFFCGELSLADFAAICYVPGAKTMSVSLGEFPGCWAGWSGCAALPWLAPITNEL